MQKVLQRLAGAQLDIMRGDITVRGQACRILICNLDMLRFAAMLSVVSRLLSEWTRVAQFLAQSAS